MHVFVEKYPWAYSLRNVVPSIQSRRSLGGLAATAWHALFIAETIPTLMSGSASIILDQGSSGQ